MANSFDAYWHQYTAYCDWIYLHTFNVTIYDESGNTMTAIENMYGSCTDHSKDGWKGFGSGVLSVVSQEVDDDTAMAAISEITPWSDDSSSIGVSESGNYYIYGPMNFTAQKGTVYGEPTVTDGNGNAISGAQLCDESGNSASFNSSIEYNPGSIYIKIPKENCQNGISQVKVDVKITNEYYLKQIDHISRNHLSNICNVR